MREYLVKEAAHKGVAFSLDGWTDFVAADCPQQNNGCDCGVFTCKFADFLSRDAPLTFAQQHMPYFRARLTHEILAGKLL